MTYSFRNLLVEFQVGWCGAVAPHAQGLARFRPWSASVAADLQAIFGVAVAERSPRAAAPPPSELGAAGGR